MQVRQTAQDPHCSRYLTRGYAHALALAQRAKKKPRVYALHAKIQNACKDWTYKATTAIVKRACLIIVGAVPNAMLAHTRLTKSVSEAV